MKKFTALALVAGLSAVSAQAQYDLQYNAEDGSLTVLNNLGLGNYVIESDGGLFLEDADNAPTTHVRVLGGTGASTPNNISESNPFNPNTESTVFLGNVLPAGLTEAEYNAAVTRADYVAGFGQPITDFNLTYIPEPTSLALLGLGGLLVARRRRG